MRRSLSIIFALSLAFLSACGSTSTPDLKLILILACGENTDQCNISENDECEGRGRWNDLRDHEEIRIEDNGGTMFRRHDLQMGNYDEASNTCTFSEDIAMKSSARYHIYIGELGPFDITKTTLENQNWVATLEFNE